MAPTPAGSDMEVARLAPTVGIAACLAVLAGLVVPYLFLDPGAVGTYYAAGAINPLFGGLFALVVGLFLVGLLAVWAASVPVSLVLGLGTNTLVEYHRWLLVVVALAVPGAAGWYVRGLGIV